MLKVIHEIDIMLTLVRHGFGYSAAYQMNARVFKDKHEKVITDDYPILMFTRTENLCRVVI